MNQKLHWKLTNYDLSHWSNCNLSWRRKESNKSVLASPHTQLSFSLSQLLTLTRYLWVQSFSWTQRKIGAYSFASQPFTSRIMSTIILYDNLHSSGYIYIFGSFRYVSNVSIIFIVPCYYIICFGCFICINMLFYIIFGTNLLT